MKKQINRERAGVISGVTGILCNVLLSVFKFIAGTLSGSISVVADAFNNLSDAVSNIVTIVGSAVSGKPVDREHPFGHGRMEYISALIVAFLILLMGFELGKSSIERILSPEDLTFRAVYLIVPVGAILVKSGMAIFNHILYKKTGNVNLKAVRQDSVNDCVATAATIVALLIGANTSYVWVDGAIGVCVSVFVLFSGVGLLKDVLGPLIGQAPSPELVENIRRIMLSEENIVGVHDIIVHEYGASRVLASAHAEMPADIDVMRLHTVVDRVEKRIEDELHVSICIHLDPVLLHDEETIRDKEMVKEVIENYSPSYSFHDFRLKKSETDTTAIFELVIPFEEKRSAQTIVNELTQAIGKKDPALKTIITVEHDYSE